MTPDNEHSGPIAWDELPAMITTYLTAHGARDTDTATGAFTDDAIVTDEGHDHHGRDEIRAWLDRSAGEYTYTTEFTAATATGRTQVDVLQHLEGNFPGGTADLHFRFTMDGALISRLVIEP